MKKIVSLLILLVAFVSCTQDISVNNSSLKAMKDGVLWRASDTRAYVGAGGDLTLVSLMRNQSLTINTSNVIPGIYTFGGSVLNKATYYYTENGTDITYVTTNTGGTGQLKITEYDVENGTVSGEFKLNAFTTVDSPEVPEVVNFIQGGFYKIPITPAL